MITQPLNLKAWAWPIIASARDKLDRRWLRLSKPCTDTEEGGTKALLVDKTKELSRRPPSKESSASTEIEFSAEK